jgi:hypothetical protein
MGSIGAVCSANNECASGMCAGVSDQRFCTQACDPKLGATCPAGWSCADVTGAMHVCEPNSLKGGSGCSAAPARPALPGGGAMLSAWLLLLVFSLALRRPSLP